ncbi:hypothetical protein BJV78DRAFT_210097 [Lactifluus subvellereus]|nr:hypothetical protein BJV78DRAFT_210097 [Lactifluus subvellereus]
MNPHQSQLDSTVPCQSPLLVNSTASHSFLDASPIPIDVLSEGRGEDEYRIEEKQRIRVAQAHRHSTQPTRTLPDNVLLEIFDFYRAASVESWDSPWKWDTLVHVCRRWRHVVFSSPRRLDLQLLCTHGTPVRRTLDRWPSLPIVIKYWSNLKFRPPAPEDEDNIIAALEHPDRVRWIQLAVTTSLFGKMVALMQIPFPALTFLSLWFDGEVAPPLPSSFLDGSAPHLQDFSLIGIPFLALPNTLLSASDLGSLQLLEIPSAGYVSPEVIVTCLSALANLEMLCVEFRSSTSHPSPGRMRLLPLRRAALPTLIHLTFRGASEYLEDLVARIDAPLLSHVRITFFNQLVFQVPHLSQFISHTEIHKSLKLAEVDTSSTSGIIITFDQSLAAPSATGPIGHLSVRISCRELDWQISSMAQICSQLSPLLSGLERLDVRADYLRLGWQDDIDSIDWLDLFRPFTAVEKLSVSGGLGPQVAVALEEVAGEMVMEVLPGLHTLHFECSRKSASVEHFVAARHVSGHPVVVRYTLFPFIWDDTLDESDGYSALYSAASS